MLLLKLSVLWYFLFVIAVTAENDKPTDNFLIGSELYYQAIYKPEQYYGLHDLTLSQRTRLGPTTKVTSPCLTVKYKLEAFALFPEFPSKNIWLH